MFISDVNRRLLTFSRPGDFAGDVRFALFARPLLRRRANFRMNYGPLRHSRRSIAGRNAPARFRAQR